MVEITEKALLIRISRTYNDSLSSTELYEITRGVWRVGNRREEASLAFAVYQNQIKEVYSILSWHPAGTTPYLSRSQETVNIEHRWEFNGELANDEIRNKYIGQSVAKYFKQGNSNPIKYVNC